MITLRNALSISILFFLLASAGTLTFVLQGLAHLLIRPFSLSLSRRIIRALSQIFLTCPSLLLEHWASVRIVTHGTKVPSETSALCLMQHACDTDALLGLAWLARFGFPYPGNAKCVVKRSLGDIPIFGWILRQTEFIFISRNWQADKDGYMSALESMREYPKPFWIVLYPEGSRFTEEKKKRCQEYCLAKGYPLVSNVLFPRFKAFTALMPKLRGTFDGIIDATIVFDGEPPTVSTMLSGTADCTLHAHIRFFPMKDIPVEEKALENWLISRWVEKDEILSKYKTNKDALGEPLAEMSTRPSLVKLYMLLMLSGFMDLAILMLALTSRTAFKALVILSTSSLVFMGIVIANVLRPSAKGSGQGRKVKTT
eukprot:Plantae.Rhodophyta-Hildenbrandia_rubra.ctg16203.p1 GENE.Plantae.Rhodophyta-Hildenbrandia_rubra.ctg16203~~Plantae.Rhodophyta-Hildenbrandia_rubra.ctg16203.p1  ORF type:complete len:370 (-),score=35.71 Plantae.Rhodophyta-Hildenbrandia_rubra.ctg16203:1831-2940(-)